MSGRRIDDHSDWIGAKEKGVPLPMKSKMKSYTSAEGAGYIGSEYPDTTEDIERDQDHGIRKAESNRMKEGYRN